MSKLPPREPIFRTIDARIGWLLPAGETWQDHEVVADSDGLRLAADSSDPRGPMQLDARDGSLGGLVLPRGFAVGADGIVYLLDEPDQETGAVVRRFDPRAGAAGPWFPALNDVGSATGDPSAPRRFCAPGNIAVANGALHVADTANQRVQVFSLAGLALRAIWGPWDWEPLDIAAHAGVVYILGADRIVRVLPGGVPHLWLQKAADDPKDWRRMAVDRQGRVHVLAVALNRAESVLEVFTPAGRADPEGAIQDAGQARSRFAVPPIRLLGPGPDEAGAAVFRLPADVCHPQAEPGALYFDRHGARVLLAPGDVPLPLLYRRSGTWVAPMPLDSEIYRCAWHRIEVELHALPPGTQMAVAYAVADDAAPVPEQWHGSHAVVGSRSVAGAQSARVDFLIDGASGRYLWVRIDLGGDGYATPVVSAIRVHFPRQSYLQYLPAVYAQDRQGRRFLERFLSIFQTSWDDLDRQIDEMEGLFDPRTTPDRFLSWLAGWIGLPLEGAWTPAQQRRLLMQAPNLESFKAGGSRRGTLAGLRDCVRAHLEAFADRSLGHADLPMLVEGFRARARLMLDQQPGNELGNAAALWSRRLTPRAQLDNDVRLDEARLISTGAPGLDLFNVYAHRFWVVVPAAWVPTRGAEELLCRTIEAEKPAHTVWELMLMEPCLRVGVQSTLGVDTLLGDYPGARLPEANPDVPRHRAPRCVLGADTVLASAEAPSAFHLGPAAHVGIDTVLS